jgi:ketosteroid isomerase-like protein
LIIVSDEIIAEHREGRKTMDMNEKRVRDFYEATIPGHRERLTSLQSAHVVYELPEGMPTGGGRFEGVAALREEFLPNFYGAFDARLVAEEFITSGERVAVIGRLVGKTREGGVPVDVPFVHVWTVREDILMRMRVFTDTAVLARALGR